jgi:uncharacterized protein
MDSRIIADKLNNLRAAIRAKKKLLVAFSGGVDSSVVAKVAQDELGRNALALIVDSETFPRAELELAVKVATELQLRWTAVKHSELANPSFVKNPVNRCYHCRKELAKVLKEVARKEAIDTIADGIIASDFNEHRPGIRAADEANIWHPLAELEFSKSDVRAVAELLRLPVYNKPPMACLSSRIPYGEEITIEKLKMIEAAEEVLKSFGFSQVRVRHYAHGPLARIEVPGAELGLFFDLKLREKITEKLKVLGYTYITVDLEGYRSGSMDEVI